MMHEPEKSDFAVVATKPANKAGRPAAEQVERRAGTEGNVASKARAGSQNRGSVTQTLNRVRQAVTTRCWSPNTLGRSRMREFCTSGSVRVGQNHAAIWRKMIPIGEDGCVDKSWRTRASRDTVSGGRACGLVI